MKYFSVFILVFLFFSCQNNSPIGEEENPKTSTKETLIPEFQSLLDSVDLSGEILIYDLENDEYFSNDFSYSRKGSLPASTFKITNSIIALETGVVENDSTLFKWNGQPRNMDIWERDLIFREAFRLSCVPCYQEIARSIGVERMNAYLEKLEYGSMQVDSTSLDQFWLVGSSAISPFGQIDFIRRLYNAELPISERTTTLLKSMMFLQEKNGYKLYGKTGWAIRDGNHTGWFVGYLESGDKTYLFATRVRPLPEFDMANFPRIRSAITLKAFQKMGVL